MHKSMQPYLDHHVLFSCRTLRLTRFTLYFFPSSKSFFPFDRDKFSSTVPFYSQEFPAIFLSFRLSFPFLTFFHSRIATYCPPSQLGRALFLCIFMVCHVFYVFFCRSLFFYPTFVLPVIPKIYKTSSYTQGRISRGVRGVHGRPWCRTVNGVGL